MAALGIFGIVIIGLVVLAAGALIAIYNSLVVARQRVNNSWSQIDVQLKKRYDLVPNLVSTVKGYAAHEKEVFEKVTEARTKALGASGVGKQAEAENMLTGALKSLFAVAENYPDLKASDNFKMLQEELTGIEEKIAYARQFYNDMVMRYQTRIQSFPTNLLAGPFGFKPRDYFEIEEGSREPVKVEF